MAKTSSIPRHRNFYRSTQGARQIPSSPSKSNGSLKLLIDDKEDDTDSEEDQNDEDDLTPTTSSKPAAHVSRNEERRPDKTEHQLNDTSLWIFEGGQLGAAQKASTFDNSVNLLGGVTAPWDMDDMPDQDEDFLGAEQSTIILKVTTRSPTKRHTLTPKSVLLSPTRKLPKNKLSKILQTDANNIGVASGSVTKTNLNLHQPSSLKNTQPLGPSELNMLNNQSSRSEVTRHDLNTETQTGRRENSPLAISAEPPPRTNLPPSAIKKNATMNGAAPKSSKKARFDSLDNQDLIQPAPFPVERSAIGQLSAQGQPTLLDASAGVVDHSASQAVERSQIEANVGKRTAEIFGPKDAAPVDLLNSPVPKSLPAPLSPVRPLVARLQPSRPKPSSSRDSSVTSAAPPSTRQLSGDTILLVQPDPSNVRAPQDFAKLKPTKAHTPLASFNRVSRNNSLKSKSAQDVEGRPTDAALAKALSITTSDLLKPTRVVRPSAYSYSRSKDSRVEESSTTNNLPEADGERPPNRIQHVATESKSTKVVLKTQDVAQLPPIPSRTSSVVENSPPSPDFNVVSTSTHQTRPLETNLDPTEREGSQTPQHSVHVKPSSRLTNRVHVSEIAGRRLSTLIELPTPESTLESMRNVTGMIKNSFETTDDLSIYSQTEGAIPNCSTPYQTGPLNLPLPPDTIHLSASRPKRSARRSSAGRLSPLKPPSIVPLDLSSHLPSQTKDSQTVDDVRPMVDSVSTTATSKLSNLDGQGKTRVSRNSTVQTDLQPRPPSVQESDRFPIPVPKVSKSMDPQPSKSTEPKTSKSTEPPSQQQRPLQPPSASAKVRRDSATVQSKEPSNASDRRQHPTSEKAPGGIIVKTAVRSVKPLPNRRTSFDKASDPPAQKGRRHEAESHVLSQPPKPTSKISSHSVPDSSLGVQTESVSLDLANKKHNSTKPIKKQSDTAATHAPIPDENVPSDRSKPRGAVDEPKTLDNHKPTRKLSQTSVKPRKDPIVSKTKPNQEPPVITANSPPVAGPKSISTASTEVRQNPSALNVPRLASNAEMPLNNLSVSGSRRDDSESHMGVQSSVAAKVEVRRSKPSEAQSQVKQIELVPNRAVESTGGPSQTLSTDLPSQTERRSNQQTEPQLPNQSVGHDPVAVSNRSSETTGSKRSLPLEGERGQPLEKPASNPTRPSKKARIPPVKLDSNPKPRSTSQTQRNVNPSERKTSSSTKSIKERLPTTSQPSMNQRSDIRKPSSHAYSTKAFVQPHPSASGSHNSERREISGAQLAPSRSASNHPNLAPNSGLTEKKGKSTSPNQSKRKRLDQDEGAAQPTLALSEGRSSDESPVPIPAQLVSTEMQKRPRDSHTDSLSDTTKNPEEPQRAEASPAALNDQAPKIEVIDLVSPCAKQATAGRFSIDLEAPVEIHSSSSPEASRILCRMSSVRRVSPQVPNHPTSSSTNSSSDTRHQDPHPIVSNKSAPPPLLTLPKEFTFTMRAGTGASERIKDRREKAVQAGSTDPKANQRPTTSSKAPGGSIVARREKPNARIREEATEVANERATKRTRVEPAPTRPPPLAGTSRSRGTVSQRGRGGRVQTAIGRLNQIIDRAPQSVPIPKRVTTKPVPTSRQPSKLSQAPPHKAPSVLPTQGSSTSIPPPPPSSTDHPTLMRSNLLKEIREKNRVKTLNKSFASRVENGNDNVPQRTGSEKGKQRAIETEELITQLGEEGVDESRRFGNSNRINDRAQVNVTRKVSGEENARTKHKQMSTGTSSTSRPIIDKPLPGSSVTFKKCLDQWREVEASQLKKSKPEWEDVSLVHHVLPVKEINKRKNMIQFGLATERRVIERENWQQNKFLKEKNEKEIQNQLKLVEKEKEKEELVKMRNDLIFKANPLPDYLKRLP